MGTAGLTGGGTHILEFYVQWYRCTELPTIRLNSRTPWSITKIAGEQPTNCLCSHGRCNFIVRSELTEWVQQRDTSNSTLEGQKLLLIKPTHWDHSTCKIARRMHKSHPAQNTTQSHQSQLLCSTPNMNTHVQPQGSDHACLSACSTTKGQQHCTKGAVECKQKPVTTMAEVVRVREV